MSLACGIVGLPNCGKTTIYGAITGTDPEDRQPHQFSTTEPKRAAVNVPDERLAKIAELIPPQKLIPGQMLVVDVPGLAAGASEGEGMGNTFLGSIKESEILLHVVRCFENENVMGSADPAEDTEIIEMELMQTDLRTVERNLERSGKKARTGDKEAVALKTVLEKAQAFLKEDKPLRLAEFSETEHELLKPLFLMSIKPVLFLANVGDDDLEGTSDKVQGLREYAARTNASVMPLCGDLEAEFARMEPDECEMFMTEMNFTESGLTRLIHAIFDLLGLQTYFTAGELEVRAWTIRKGDTAPVGAGVIHTDFEAKFIRAEIYSYEDLVEFQTETAIKQAGKMRLEGKTYVLQDGDICHFLIGN
jgi:ribosome-binding ATPase